MRKGLILAAAVLAWTFAGPAQAADPVLGLWFAPEPSEGTVTVIELYGEGDTLAGRVLRIVDRQQHEVKRRCTRCAGAQRNQPLAGMRFLWGLQRENGRWVSGTVMDLREGLTQGMTATAELSVHGETMELHAYRGLRALGQRRTWYRSADAAGIPVAPASQASPER